MISISNFTGIIPRKNPAVLPNEAAQTAQNCVLWHGDVRALKAPLTVVTPTALASAIKSIYKIGMTLPETQYWMAWTTDVDVVRGMIADDTSERTYFTGDGVPKVTNLTMATQGGSTYPVNSYALGVPAPTVAPTCTPSSSAVPVETRVYIYTYVSGWGEEGAPSPPTSVVVSQAGTVALSAMNTAPGGNYDIVSKRIYRSQQTTGANAIYEYVTEISDATTTFNDTLTSTQLGEQLTTLTYAMPPPTLAGLVALPNGIAAGFSGYDLYFCEPFLLYAWPEKYRLTTDYPIVGLGTFGTSLLVCTTGAPYLVTGVHPDSMSMEKIELDQSCVAKRSIVSVGGGAMYASPDGIVYVGAGGSRIATLEHYTREEWQALNPSTITAFFHDGKYIATFSGGGGFILDSLEDANLTTFDDVVTAGHTDTVNDGLYFVVAGIIKRFNAGTAKTYTWRSKKYQFANDEAPRCARVDADTYPVTFNLYADGTLKFTKTVASQKVFKLPKGYRPREIELEVVGTTPVRLVATATNPMELKIG